MGILPYGGRNGGGGTTGGGDLHLPPPEKSCTVHCDQAHYVPVSGGGEASGVMSGQSVVGEGKFGLGGDANGRPGGETGGGGGGDERYGDGGR